MYQRHIFSSGIWVLQKIKGKKNSWKFISLCNRVTYLTFIPACFASSSAEHGCWVLMKLSKIPALYPNPNTRVLIPSLTICSKSRGSSDAIEQKLTYWRLNFVLLFYGSLLKSKLYVYLILFFFLSFVLFGFLL